MSERNDWVTKKEFRDGMRGLEERMDAKIDAKIDALALSTQQEFVSVREEIARKIWESEVRILNAIGDIAKELKNHDMRILALEKIVKP